MKEISIEKVIAQFIAATNAFDVDTTLALFTKDAVIDDVSVGEKFKNTEGVRTYLEKFFVGYKTVTRLESLQVLDHLRAKALVDFTGDFDHETGALDFTFNSDGLITGVGAYLD